MVYSHLDKIDILWFQYFFVSSPFSVVVQAIMYEIYIRSFLSFCKQEIITYALLPVVSFVWKTQKEISLWQYKKDNYYEEKERTKP